MKKKEYISPEFTLRLFSEDEVITASVVTTAKEPIELPFVPVN